MERPKTTYNHLIKIYNHLQPPQKYLQPLTKNQNTILNKP